MFEVYNFIDKKFAAADPSFRNMLKDHVQDEKSELRYVLDSIRDGKISNSTESRMILYTSEIAPYLYPRNSFLQYSVSDTSFAANGKTKRLNISAEGPSVTKGRVYGTALAHGANAPTSTVKVRKNSGADVEIEYFRTTPDAISMELTSEVPYAARQEMLKAHADIIRFYIENFALVEWAQGAIGTAETVDITQGANNFFVFTSGDKRATGVQGGSGTVSAVTKDDLIALKSAFSRQQMSGKKIVFLPTVEQLEDMRKIPEFIDYEKNGQANKIAEGKIGRVYGVDILDERHREDWGANILYTYTALGTSSTETTLTKVEDTASSSTSMVSAGIAWCVDEVVRAEGSTVVFPWNNSPIYYGDVYAAESRFGAYKRRADNKGVVMLVENPFTLS